MVDSHEVAERARLLSHERYAAQVDQDRSILRRAMQMVEGFPREALTDGERAWLKLLKRQWHEVRPQMLRDDPEGRLLRSNSPFSVILGSDDLDSRRELWRKAKSDLSQSTFPIEAAG